MSVGADKKRKDLLGFKPRSTEGDTGRKWCR